MSNIKIKYQYRDDEQSFEFWYELETKKNFIYTRYQKNKASSDELCQFYGVCVPPPITQQQKLMTILVNESFGAYKSVFIVISFQGNMAIWCVTDDNDDINTIYFNGLEYNFEINFVRNKATKYLIN